LVVEGLGEAMITCHFCKNDVDPRETGVHQYTRGWVKIRSGGGGHGVSIPIREPFFAHGHCVERRIKGWGQLSLLDAHPEVENSPPPIEDNGTNAGFEENGMLVHVCNVCGGRAPYGIGVSLRDGLTGLWYCGEHKPLEVELG
jgi:hypothetical protein